MINYEIMIKKGQHVHRSEAMAKRVANKPSDKQKKRQKNRESLQYFPTTFRSCRNASFEVKTE